MSPLKQDPRLNQVERQAALQCAPLLLNVKISNLLIVYKEHKRDVEALFEQTPISVALLCETEAKVVFLLYRQHELIHYLQDKNVSSAIHNLGYEQSTLEAILPTFSIRYSTYMTKGGEFPHELGLLLGYPVEDVIGFIEHEGRNFLYSGYWKVYSDLSHALNLFEEYNRAKQVATTMISNGYTIQDIMNYAVHTRTANNKTMIN